jgi:hypothetical protein
MEKGYFCVGPKYKEKSLIDDIHVDETVDKRLRGHVIASWLYSKPKPELPFIVIPLFYWLLK